MTKYLTRSQAKEQGINRKDWKRYHKKLGKQKKHRIHIHKTQDTPSEH